MRRIVDRARARGRIKRGGEGRQVALGDWHGAVPARAEALLALDEALERLSKSDSRRADVVELRFFGGLTVEETAEALGTSPETVVRDWRVARLWLWRELKGRGSPMSIDPLHAVLRICDALIAPVMYWFSPVPSARIHSWTGEARRRPGRHVERERLEGNIAG